jgi:hypothetical protein
VGEEKAGQALLPVKRPKLARDTQLHGISEMNLVTTNCLYFVKRTWEKLPVSVGKPQLEREADLSKLQLKLKIS